MKSISIQESIMNINSTESPTQIQKLKIISRISAWLLLAAAVVLVFSGWGITRTEIIYKITFGLVDRRLANYLHRFTNIPLAILFLSHLLINIRFMLFRKIPKKIHIFDGILIVMGLLVALIVIYMEFWA
jgi:cytochrome b subunit of formate dehydrogenase